MSTADLNQIFKAYPEILRQNLFIAHLNFSERNICPTYTSFLYLFLRQTSLKCSSSSLNTVFNVVLKTFILLQVYAEFGDH